MQKYLTAKHMLGETDDIVLAADVRVELEGDIESKRQGAEDAFVIHDEEYVRCSRRRIASAC